MATVERGANNRKLSVAETLKQATLALETHRAWMKRRVSTSVAPSDGALVEERGGGNTWAVGDVEEDSRKAVSVAWALGSDKNLRDNEQGGSPTATSAAATQPAPPLSSSSSLQRGAVRKGPRPYLPPLDEETDDFHIHRHQDSGSSSATSPAGQVAVSLLDSPTTPFPHHAHGLLSPGSPGDGPQGVAPSGFHFTFPTSSQSRQTNSQIMKKQRIGKATVVPTNGSVHGEPKPTTSGQKDGGVLDSGQPKSPDVFIGESFHSSPPLPSSMLVAWGSLTSLDNYIESLESSSLGPQKQTHPGSAKADKRLDLKKLENGEEITTEGSSREAVSIRFTSSTPSSGNLTGPDNLQSSDFQSNIHSTPSPSKDEQDSLDSLETTPPAEHFESLKKASTSSTLIPVTPAPRGQRSSFAMHKQSKLMAAEAETKIYDVHHRKLSDLLRESQPGGGNTGVPSQHSLKGRATANIPDSVLQSVLPKEREKLHAMSGFATAPLSNDQDDTGGYVMQPSKPVKPVKLEEGETDVDFHLPPSSLSPPVPQTPATTTLVSPLTPLEEEQPSQESKTGLDGCGPSPAPVTGSGESLEEKEGSVSSESSIEDVAGSSEVLEEDRHGSSPKLKEKRSAFESLGLPPLKVKVDGSRMIKRLPSLNLQSPLTPHLIAFSSLSRKREHPPPPYLIHRPPGNMALPPPCPIYGAQQPLEKDILRVISTHRGSLSPDDIDALLAAGANAHSISHKTGHGSSESHAPDTDKGRRLSVAGLRSSQPAREQRDETAIEDIEMNSSFHSTFVLRSSHGNDESGGRGNNYESVDVAPLTPAPPTFVIPSAPHVSPGPGPLHLAAKSGNLRRLQSLIYQGHDVDLPDQDGRTPLMYCIHSRGVHLSCADALIQQGANLNKQSSDGSTAMHLAASVGAIALIELLLLNGANPDIRDFEGRLALHWSTIQQSSKTITLLLQHSNFDINVADDSGMTPLMWSAYHNNAAITSFLLHKGADCEEKDIDGYTAMHWAIHRTGTDCLRLLLKPDMTYFKDHRGRTVIHLAAKDGAMAASELIVKMRPDAIFDTDKQGHTPLHYAAACSRVDVCALLLDLGGDATQRDSEGLSPLDYARRKKLDYVVALLTCHGTAVADFARASRTTNISSFLNRTVSFSQLNTSKEEEERDSSTSPAALDTSKDQTANLSTSSTNLSKSLSSISGLGSAPHSKLLEDDGHLSASIGHLNQTADSALSPEHRHGNRAVDSEDEGVEMETAKGGYLGRFTTERRDPIKHYYFWLKHAEGSICWSRLRENANRNSQRATVLEVHEGASQSVKKNPSYSPGDLHKYVFWVLTGGGVLDLFAYNEDAYGMWLANITSLAASNAKKGLENLPLKKQSRTTSRPSSTHGRYSRAAVAPGNYDASEVSSLSSALNFEPTTEATNDNTNGKAVDDDTRTSGSNSSRLSIFTRSQSVPAHLLPLTSTPQYSNVDRSNSRHFLTTHGTSTPPTELVPTDGNLKAHAQTRANDDDII